MYVGKPAWLDATIGDRRHSGLATRGDVYVIPCSVPSVWESKQTETALVLSPSSRYLRDLADQSELDSGQLSLRYGFQMRDPQIECVAWAVMAEAEQGFPSGELFVQGLATALAARLLQGHGALANKLVVRNEGLAPHKLRNVLTYIEANLSDCLSLHAIAAVAGLSESHFKVLFRKSMGMPLHQYVIKCRVERAAFLLRRGDLPISQVAYEAGFCHQSHLAVHMRRFLGTSPRDFAKMKRAKA